MYPVYQCSGYWFHSASSGYIEHGEMNTLIFYLVDVLHAIAGKVSCIFNYIDIQICDIYSFPLYVDI